MIIRPPIQGFKQSEQSARLRLIRTDRIGPVTFHQLVARYGSGEKAIESLPGLAAMGGGRGPLKVAPKAQAERELSALLKAGVKPLYHGTPDYPLRLSMIDDAPPILFARGHTHLLKKDCLGIVGTRNASAAGLNLVKALVPPLGGRDLVVASGLAKGIDAAAHKASLQHGTIACMAGGVDWIYPRQNSDLYHEIAERGCLISEMPMGTEPQARHFPRRNRLISGLSLGVLVIEATLRSGSLITARMAGEQGREVFAVPGSPLDPRSQGGNRLIRDGATLVESADDVLFVIDPLRRRPIAEPDYLPLFGTDRVPGDPTEEEIEGIRQLLSPTPTPIDDLIQLSGIGAGALQAALLALELAGQAERLPGGRVILLSPLS